VHPVVLQDSNFRLLDCRCEVAIAVGHWRIHILFSCAEIVADEAVSRNAIGGFRREGVSMVCVCYLDMSGHTSPLRFLLKRLRQRVGDARLLVALWPSDHPVISGQKIRDALSADEYVTSLRDAVNACLKAAQEAAAAYKRRATTTVKTEGRPPEILARADTRGRS
jgi:hypothetical protein